MSLDIHEMKIELEQLRAHNDRLETMLRRWVKVADQFRDRTGLSLKAHPIYDETLES